MRAIKHLTFALAVCLLPFSVPRSGNGQTSEIQCDQLAGLAIPFDRIDSRKAEDACRAAVRSDPANPHLLFQLGRALKSGKNDAEAAKYYKEAADRGNAFAMYELAVFYEYGRGVEKNLATAADLFRKAAELGVVEAMHAMGNIYEDGIVVPQNFATAKSWYEKAAERGLGIAMNNLGSMYANGKGGPKDYHVARSWYEKADAAGSTAAPTNLGLLYFYGRGVQQDFSIAKQWFEKGFKRGDPMGALMLGELFEDGKGVKTDYAQAKAWYEKAASMGSKEALKKIRGVDIGLSQPRALYLDCELSDEGNYQYLYRLYIDDPESHQKFLLQIWDRHKQEWSLGIYSRLEVTDLEIRLSHLVAEKWPTPGRWDKVLTIDRVKGHADEGDYITNNEGIEKKWPREGTCKKGSPWTLERKF